MASQSYVGSSRILAIPALIGCPIRAVIRVRLAARCGAESESDPELAVWRIGLTPGKNGERMGTSMISKSQEETEVSWCLEE